MSGEITVSMKMLILSNNNQNSCKYIIMKNNNVNRHIRFTATSVREEVIFEVMPNLGKSWKYNLLLNFITLHITLQTLQYFYETDLLESTKSRNSVMLGLA